MTLGQQLSCSVPQFPPLLKEGYDSPSFPEFLYESQAARALMAGS